MLHSKLKEILKQKEEEIKELKGRSFKFHELPKRSFSEALLSKGISLIAEIKFASPSAGIIRSDLSALEVAKIYEQQGAAAISVLTEKHFFKGDISWLPEIKKSVSIPVLRKDFILDPIQLEESKAFGADAVLIIVRTVSNSRLKELVKIAKELELECLVEVHNKDEISMAEDVGAKIIGINNRDLETFKIDLNLTFTLASYIPKECVKVSESGISEPDHIKKLKEKGINAVLVGTAIMKSKNIKQKVKELVEAGKDG
jgi:indole-3-glycerol phosphate synthase